MIVFGIYQKSNFLELRSDCYFYSNAMTSNNIKNAKLINWLLLLYVPVMSSRTLKRPKEAVEV